MARGIALSELVRRVRLELGRSATAISNTDEEATLKNDLRRVQEFYYDDYNWPHLNAIRSIALVNNGRFYPFPSTMNLESTVTLWVKDNDTYVPVPRGISFPEYNAFDSLVGVAATGSFEVTGGTLSAGVNNVTSITVNSVEALSVSVDHTGDNSTTAAALATQINAFSSVPNYFASSSGAVVTIIATLAAGNSANTFAVSVTPAGDVTVGSVTALSGGVDSELSDPVTKWEILENDQTDTPEIEVWPVPSAVDTLFLTGKRNLSTLLLDADTADLDDQLLVLTVAAETLAGNPRVAGKARAKAGAARARYNQLKRLQNAGKLPFILGGGVPGQHDHDLHGTTVTVSGTVEI